MKRQIYLPVIAVLLIAAAVIVNLRDGGEPDMRPPALTAAEVATLTPGLDADVRMLDHLRRIAGAEPEDWRRLPPAGQTLFATLYVEEVQRTLGWGQLAISDVGEIGLPTLADAETAYGELGQREAAAAVRAFAGEFSASRSAFQAWTAGPRGPGAGAPPDMKQLERHGNELRRFLSATRAARLDHLRAHAGELAIR